MGTRAGAHTGAAGPAVHPGRRRRRAPGRRSRRPDPAWPRPSRRRPPRGAARLWLGLGAAGLATLLCCGGGLGAGIGLGVTGAQAVNEQAQAVVGEYLDALRAGRYAEAYEALCPRLREARDAPAVRRPDGRRAADHRVRPGRRRPQLTAEIVRARRRARTPGGERGVCCEFAPGAGHRHRRARGVRDRRVICWCLGRGAPRTACRCWSCVSVPFTPAVPADRQPAQEEAHARRPHRLRSSASPSAGASSSRPARSTAAPGRPGTTARSASS